MLTVVLEGPDGSGKTTIAKLLGKVLDAQVVHFPNDDEPVTGPLIRSYLRKEWEAATTNGVGGPSDPKLGSEHWDTRSAVAFQALQLANRLATFCTLDPQRPVVFARYWQSGWVYGQLDGLDRTWLRDVHVGMTAHDHILLDLNTETAMERRAARDGDLTPERYEGRSDLVARTIKLYRELWAEEELRQGHTGEWYVVNAAQPIEAVLADVMQVLVEHAVRQPVALR